MQEVQEQEAQAEEQAEEGVKMALSAYISVLRPINCIIAAFGVLIGYFISIGAAAFPNALFIAMLSAFLVCGAGQAINDFYDAAIDARVRQSKPIPSGKADARIVFWYAIALFALGIAVSWFINLVAFSIAFFFSLVLFYYSAFLRRRKYIGNWVVALGTSFTLVFGASISGNYSIVLVLALCALFANAAREILKDIEDVNADKGHKVSLPMKIGAGNVKVFALAFYIIAIILAFLPYVFGHFTNLYYPSLIALASIVFICSSALSFKNKIHSAQNISKLGMVIALLGFLSGII